MYVRVCLCGVYVCVCVSVGGGGSPKLLIVKVFAP